MPDLVAPLEQTPDFSLLHLNQLKDCDRAAHNWYRFVLSFPPHLVQDYLKRFGINAGQCVLDPFCGTGTTVVDAKMLGIASVGVEANPMAHFAGSVKLDWSPNPDELVQQAERIAERATKEIERSGDWRSLPEDS
ncbi:MAG: site-specific DNA-methyltransferase, partial [Leptolyngbyaceae cyanobacterium CAN_BIN12]|nr:site-specific DNA-methyltransferase [Leptolyngbyaceae cyanobacterium CAN_BIN12]